MEQSYKTPEQIQEDLKHISPLALPEYLANCEYYDKSNAFEVLDEAVKEFEGKQEGGIGKAMIDVMLPTSVQAVSMVFLKKCNQSLYDKALKGKVNWGGIIKQAITFQYDASFIQYSKGGDELLHYGLKHDASGISDPYKRKEWDNDKRKDEFKKNYSEDTDIIGQNVYKTEQEAQKAGADPNRDIITVDHVIPLAKIHDQYGSFAQRYVGQEKMNQIANSDENFQAMNQSSNSSKNDKSVKEWVDGLKERLDQKPDDPERERKGKAVAAEEVLLQKEKESKKFIQTELLKSGTETVLLEQIGKIVETLTGPVIFEIRESCSYGVCHGFNTDNLLEALCGRAKRVLLYMFHRLPGLIGDLIGDLSQMLIHLATTIFDLFTGIFKKFIGIIMSGISTIIDSVKICFNKDMSPAQKGDAITKLLVALMVNVIGNFALDALFPGSTLLSEIFSPIISAVLSAVAIYFFDKLDLFNLKRELRRQRIEEIFALRKQKLQEASQQFDIIVSEKLKQQRIAMEKIRQTLNDSFKAKDFETLNSALDDACALFCVEVPYKNTMEFMDYLRKNPQIVIC